MDDVTPVSSPRTLENWDSIQQLNLVLELESHFDIQFSPEEMTEMENIESIARVISRKLDARVLTA